MKLAFETGTALNARASENYLAISSKVYMPAINMVLLSFLTREGIQ